MFETMKSVGNLIEKVPTAHSPTAFQNEDSGKTPDVDVKDKDDLRDPRLQYEAQEKKIKIYPTFYETVFREIARHYKDTYLKIEDFGFPEIHKLCQVYHDITKKKEDNTETFASNLVCLTELMDYGVLQAKEIKDKYPIMLKHEEDLDKSEKKQRQALYDEKIKELNERKR